MQVVHHQYIVPRNFIHRDEILNGLLKCLHRFVMVQVADVLADEGLSVDDERHGILQIGSHREDRPAGSMATAAGA